MHSMCMHAGPMQTLHAPDAPGSGLGWEAEQPLHAGQLLMVCRPLAILHGRQVGCGRPAYVPVLSCILLCLPAPSAPDLSKKDSRACLPESHGLHVHRILFTRSFTTL